MHFLMSVSILEETLQQEFLKAFGLLNTGLGA